MTNQPHRITLPVLMLLTSHRKDCFDLCLWCLEAFTDLNRFKRIYVLDNDVTEEHRESIRAFSQRHDHVAVVRCSPRGLVPAVMQAQNAILAEHARDGVIKVDEDVFVTPHWLEHLLGAYNQHADANKVLLAGCVTPVSLTGKTCLHSFFRRHFPEIAAQARISRIYDDPVYHLGVWDAVLHGDFSRFYAAYPRPTYHYASNIIIQCVVYGQKLLDAVLPFPCARVDGSPVTDELAVNLALSKMDARAVLPSAGLVYHYSHATCLDHMLAHTPVEEVREYMMGLEPARGRAVAERIG
jgi:hypothetical protein